MKKLITGLSLLLNFTAYSQINLGLFAGPQITGAHYLINGKEQESSVKFGLNTGAMIKIPVENKLYFSPSVMYNLRGYKVEFDGISFPPDPLAVDNNTSFHTIELAFLLQHDFTSKPDHFFIRIGPSLDFALFGKEKYNTTGSAVNRNMKFSFGDYGHYLASAIFQFGYENKSGMFCYAYYNYGLTTMNNADHGPKIGNRAAGFSVGKYIKRKL